MTIVVLAPAKVNLGLEVIRRRDDGFHDIATVFQTISVFDRLRLETASSDSVVLTDPNVRIDANLVSRALDLSRHAGITERHWQVELSKRIPMAAGLGGASADAAGALAALAEHGDRNRVELTALALELGSDVPFLLQGGAAIASGRGERLEPLPPLSNCWMVLAAPSIELERKTARLYGTLGPGDFSQGSRVARVATALRDRQLPDPADLKNAFSRPLLEIIPEIARLHAAFHQAGAPFVALSGAGPTHYAIVQELAEALRIARTIRQDCPLPMRVLIARPTGSGPSIHRKKTIDSTQTL